MSRTQNLASDNMTEPPNAALNIGQPWPTNSPLNHSTAIVTPPINKNQASTQIPIRSGAPMTMSG